MFNTRAKGEKRGSRGRELRPRAFARGLDRWVGGWVGVWGGAEWADKVGVRDWVKWLGGVVGKGFWGGWVDALVGENPPPQMSREDPLHRCRAGRARRPARDVVRTLQRKTSCRHL